MLLVSGQRGSVADREPLFEAETGVGAQRRAEISLAARAPGTHRRALGTPGHKVSVRLNV